jgi:hypothetical protein
MDPKPDDRWKELHDLLGLDEPAPRPEAPRVEPEPAVQEPTPGDAEAQFDERDYEPIETERLPDVAEQEIIDEDDDTMIDESQAPNADVEAAEPDSAPEGGEEKPRRGGRRRRRGRRRHDEDQVGAPPRDREERRRDDRPQSDQRERREETTALDRADAEDLGEPEVVAEGGRPRADVTDDDTDFSDWNVPSWQELIASLYRPDR